MPRIDPFAGLLFSIAPLLAAAGVPAAPGGRPRR